MITLYATNTDKRFEIEQSSFPDGTLHINLPDTHIYAIKWAYESDAELFTLICIAKHYDYPGMELYLPYIPHARMDRVKSETDVFTLKYFCEVINSLNFKTVWVMDAHSNVSLALLDRVRQMNVEDTIYDTIYKVTCEIAGGYDHQQRMDAQANLVVFFPDEGAMKRYSDMANMPYAFGIKKRDWETGKILGLDIMNAELVKGKNVLIIDDICSRGGTFLHAAKALKAAGANRIFLHVTHAEKTMVEGEMYNNLDLVERIYTTDSIFNIEWDDRNKVTIVNKF
jgi:ribose-phosphate pyrophosphokinase